MWWQMLHFLSSFFLLFILNLKHPRGHTPPPLLLFSSTSPLLLSGMNRSTSSLTRISCYLSTPPQQDQSEQLCNLFFFIFFFFAHLIDYLGCVVTRFNFASVNANGRTTLPVTHRGSPLAAPLVCTHTVVWCDVVCVCVCVVRPTWRSAHDSLH